MRRAVLGFYTYLEFFLVALLFVPILGFVALIHRRDPGRRVRGRWMRNFGKLTSALTPIWRFSAQGTKPADIDTRPYVVVSNHESTADPFLLAWLPWDMRWVAKESIFKLPVIGWLMKFGGDIPLRRGERESVQVMLDECRRTLAAGVSVMMFPEGTRSPDGALLPFKDGAFQLAIEAGVPVLPVIVQGTRTCRPKGSLWFGEARAVTYVLEPIPTAGLTLADVPKLRERARDMIAEALERVRGQALPAKAA
jgi:1-acyl-sn-glycerol-3-phosphate acyltransferase